MFKDENPTFLNIVAFVLFVMVFGCIYAIWTNFIPNEKWRLISLLISLIFASFYSGLSFLIKTDNLNKYRKICISITVFVSCYFLCFYNLSYSLSSIATEFSVNEFSADYVVLERRERKLPLFVDLDCPYYIHVSECNRKININKVCLSYAEVMKVKVNDVICVQGKESWFGRKVKNIK